MTTIIGIDYSGAQSDRNTWVAQGRLTSDGALIFEGANMIRRKDVVNLLIAVSTPAVSAMDFPFCIPREFAEFLNTGDDLEAMPDVWRIIDGLTLEDFYSARDAFVDRWGEPKRAGDAAHFSESFSPLHKVNPNMVPMTYYGIMMLCGLYEKQVDRWIVPPMEASGDQSETVTLLETMPGAFLRAIGAIYKGYKKPKSALLRDERRNAIMDAVERNSGVALPNLSTLREDCIANDDCLDAVVAAVAAASWARNSARFRHPDEDELAAARLEGWIYVPMPQSAELTGSATFSIRTAQTLYSGIPENGSSASLVRKLAACSCSLTKGTKTSPGRILSV